MHYRVLRSCKSHTVCICHDVNKECPFFTCLLGLSEWRREVTIITFFIWLLALSWWRRGDNYYLFYLVVSIVRVKEGWQLLPILPGCKGCQGKGEMIIITSFTWLLGLSGWRRSDNEGAWWTRWYHHVSLWPTLSGSNQHSTVGGAQGIYTRSASCFSAHR